MVNKVQFVILWILATGIAFYFWRYSEYLNIAVMRSISLISIGGILLLTFSPYNPFGRK
jgi:hypothetical protein